MSEPLLKPTPELVLAACKEFDEQNQTVEQALTELFCQYPDNRSHPGVLLKVVALNRLYSTQIFAVMDVADHIHRQAQEIDFALASGSPAVVEKIAKVVIKGKVHNFWCFATKYCSWHNPACYPIWDSRVDRYLWCLQKQTQFAASFRHADLWNYDRFREIVTAFRDHFHLGPVSFKQIDKFLWLSGEELMEGDFRS